MLLFSSCYVFTIYLSAYTVFCNFIVVVFHQIWLDINSKIHFSFAAVYFAVLWITAHQVPSDRKAQPVLGHMHMLISVN